MQKAQHDMQTLRGLNGPGRLFLALLLLTAWATAAHAEEITIPVPFAKGQAYVFEVTASRETTTRAADGTENRKENPPITLRRAVRVLEGNGAGFVFEQRLTAFEGPAEIKDARQAVAVKLAEATHSARLGSVTRLRTNAYGQPVNILNTAEIREHVTRLKDTLVSTFGAELAVAGLKPKQVDQAQSIMVGMIDRLYFESDEHFTTRMTEDLTRLTLPLGLLVDPDAPRVYGDPDAGQYEEDGTAGTIRVVAHDPAKRTLTLEWVQHYAPDLLRKAGRASNAAVSRIDRSTYEIDLTTGLPVSVVTTEVIETESAGRVREEITTKRLTLRPA